MREYGDGGSGISGELQHAMERIRTVVEESGGGRSTTAAMANLAEAIQGLVAHMRTEQQMIREWADGQGEQNREIKKLLERIASSPRRAERQFVSRTQRSTPVMRRRAGPIDRSGSAEQRRTLHRVRDTRVETRMALARARRSESGFNYWPGFVDALSTLVLSIVFLLSVFLVVQFFLSQEVTGKDKALEQLNAKIAQLNDLLSLEKLGKLALDDQVGQLRAGLAAAESERDRIKGLYEGLAGAGGDAQGRANELNKALESEKSVSSRALAQIEVLNQQISALRRQLAALEEALEVSEKRDKESQGRIADLGQRLNVALAQRVQELSRYRSEFFGRLRAILGNRPDIRIVGDRFVFQSEVFFDTGQALLLPEGRAELDKLATALIDLDKQIPSEIGWVLRVDGHTDMRPINSPLFKSNWELSSARAISVVQYLVFLGVPAQRLVAAGFAEFQPLDTAPTEEAYKRNRRIELKLTER